MQIKTLPSLCLAFVMFLVSCSNNSDNKSNSADSAEQTQKETSTNSNTSETVRANINVSITGGDMAGTYTAACKDACCSWGIAGENVFGNQYSETGKGNKELSSVQLIIDDVKGNKSTKEFTLTVSFGELFSETGKTYNIDTRKGKNEGSGNVDLQYSGDRAVVTIKGVSKEGPGIDLKLECNRVINPNNLGE